MSYQRGQDICDRSFVFATRIVKLCRFLTTQQHIDPALIRQLLRSGTSIGANVEEAQAGQSAADFIHKYGIALKEARETRYWLRLFIASDCIEESMIADLLDEVEQLMKIIAAIRISASRRRSSNP